MLWPGLESNICFQPNFVSDYEVGKHLTYYACIRPKPKQVLNVTEWYWLTADILNTVGTMYFMKIVVSNPGYESIWEYVKEIKLIA